MNNRVWFANVFRIIITFLVFGFYIALVFFSFKQNWKFLLTFEYYLDTGTSTVLALMFRWLYSDSGVAKELELNDDIRNLETGKGNLVSQVNSNNLTDLLKIKIDKQNEENKLQAYKDKCDKKINFYREKGWYKFNRKGFLNKWRVRKEEISSDDFNINTIKVHYYKYDIDEMLSTFYKQPNKDRNKRLTKNTFVVSSLRTNVITLLAFMLYNAITVFQKGFSKEDLIILIGKLTIFAVNIYTGYNLGRDYIKNLYSSNLTDDYTFLKGFLKENKVEGMI